MKYIIAIICCLSVCNASYSQDFVHHVYNAPVIEIQPIPQYTISTYQTYVYKPMVYQWVPQIVNEPVIIEYKGLFCYRSTILYKPTIRWVYQLSYLK